MKAFIKPPKKNDATANLPNDTRQGRPSSSAHAHESMTRPPVNGRKFTPTSSPKLQQVPQYTPPANVLAASTTNSPKKLLTPIKNLFTSTKSAGQTPGSSDNLQNVILNTTSPKESKSSRFKKHIRSRSNASVPTINDLMKPPERPKGDKKLKLTASSPSLQALEMSNSRTPTQTPQFGLGESRPLEFVDVPPTSANVSSLGPPILLSRDSSKNISIASLAESERFNTKEVFFDATSLSYINDKDDLKTNHTSYSSESMSDEYDDDDNEDNEDDEDDNSSQFSFVQDMKAGRNTSVKYYKTSVAKPKLEQSLMVNSFDEHDLGHDDEDVMDYDFENNGLGDDDDNYDEYNEFDGENAAYNEMFLNDDLRSQATFNSYVEFCEEHEKNDVGIDLQKTVSGEDPSFGNISSSFSPEKRFNELTSRYDFPTYTTFNSSHHLSIQGPSKTEDNELATSPKRESIEEDILENYLDPSILNSIHSGNGLESPSLQQENDFALFDVSSPVINGLTIGHNLGHRSNRKGQNFNRSLIHRNPINVPIDHIGHHSRCESEIYERERYIHSFHESLDDNININIMNKVKGFEDWWMSRRTEQSAKYDEDVSGIGKTSSLGNKQSQTTLAAAANLSIDDEADKKTNTAVAKSANVDKIHAGAANKQNRNSVAELMGLLSNLELQNQDAVPAEKINEPSNFQNRNSVAEMMGLLSNLELSLNSGGNTEAEIESNKKEVRSSIAGMMNFLASVEGNEASSNGAQSSENGKSLEASRHIHKNQALPQLDHNPPASHITRKPSFKRYSWFSSQESLTLKGVDPTDDSIKPIPLDQDILDEINQIPEDYDYDEQRNKIKQADSEKAIGFERSSSYNRRPKKVLVLNQAKPNKIETSNKTVTFYDKSKASSPAMPLDLNRVKNSNLSRGLSFRSVSSIPSVSEINEEEEDEDDEDNTSIIPVHVRIEKSND